MKDTIEDLLRSWGEWRNREMRARPIQGAAMYTPGATDVSGRYRQRCELCLGRKIDPGQVGSRVIRQSDADYAELKRKCPCPSCNGRGYHTVKAAKADPGAIRRTGPGGMHVPIEETPREMERLEAVMNAFLSNLERLVLVAKYVAFPRRRAYNPEMTGRSARVAWVNQAIAPEKISDHDYGNRLSHAKRVLSRELQMPIKDQERRNAS